MVLGVGANLEFNVVMGNSATNGPFTVSYPTSNQQQNSKQTTYCSITDRRKVIDKKSIHHTGHSKTAN